MPIPIIDLFAGPGGLGEGFSSVLDGDGLRKFKIKLSVEKDEFAHSTLELRAFFREFPPHEAPPEYYQYLRGEISRSKLYALYPKQASEAQSEAWHTEMGGDSTTDDAIDERIVKALGGKKRWVLIGGPPCQAYSLVGRSRVIGGQGLKKYEEDPRHELYLHYLRILAVHQPPVFIMENVKGLLSARVNKESMFDRILGDLRNPTSAISSEQSRSTTGNVKYKLWSLVVGSKDLLGELEPKDFVVNCEKHGIPQARHRIIILGTRADLDISPELLKEEDSPTVAQIIGDLPKLRSGLSKEQDDMERWLEAVGSLGNAGWLAKDSFDESLREAIFVALSRMGKKLGRGGAYCSHISDLKFLSHWFLDPHFKGVVNHETRGHIRSDLHRYLFSAVFARQKGRSPLLENFPKSLLPNHQNVAEALKETKFNDRFRVQLASRPSTTITSHIAKDGHYFIHYDPLQCRSLTVREAARLQTFPDNYYFEGPRTEQYKQVGNAVPPLLAHKIAVGVAKLFN